MSKLLEWIIGAAITVIVPAVLYALARNISWIASIGKTVEAMKAGAAKRTEETQTMVKAIMDLTCISQRTLRAIRDGECNGNITQGLKECDDTQDEMQKMLVARTG